MNSVFGLTGWGRLQTDPAGRVVGLRVPAPWVGSAILMGPHGWVLNIYGYPTHIWVPNGLRVLGWVLGPGFGPS
jgi:hypothetical protein